MIKYENVKANEETLARIVLFRNDTSLRVFTFHWHNSMELLYCYKGKLEVRMNAELYVLNPGDLLYIDSNIPHETASREPNEVFMIQFKEPFYDAKKFTVKLNTIEKNLDLEVSNFLMETIRKAYAIQKDQKPFYTLQLNSVLFDLKHQIATNFLELKSEQKAESIEFFEALEYIKHHVNSGIDVTQVANHLGYSLGYFSKRFKEEWGISCMEYIQNCRLKNAINQLETTKLEISEIALNSGFPNTKSFRIALQTNTGLSPSKYRELHHKR